MIDFRDASIRAAWMADFNEHLPLTEGELRKLYAERGGNRTVRGLREVGRFLASLGRFRGRRPEQDYPSIAAFAPPL